LCTIIRARNSGSARYGCAAAYTNNMAHEDVRTPEKHDRVTAQGRNGVYTVVDVDESAKTVSLQTVTGDGPVITGVPWTTLDYMDQEGAN